MTQHANLLDLPDPIADAFSSGRARDVTLVNEMLLMYKTMPQEVTDWLADPGQEVTRSAVKLLRSFLDSRERTAQTDRVYQQVGKTMIRHELEQFGRMPELGRKARIRYKE